MNELKDLNTKMREESRRMIGVESGGEFFCLHTELDAKGDPAHFN